MKTMKKLMMLLMFVLMVGMTVFAQENVATPEKVGLLAKLGMDAGSLVSIGLMIFAIVFATAYSILKVKLREAAKLLLMVADAIEDKKVDANERKDIAIAARELIKIPKKE